MSESRPEDGIDTYVNPVYPHSFPDPYILKFRGEYYAYCTGFAPDGDVFAVLHSSDLVNWTPLGSAMKPIPSAPPFYWAPEVNYAGGRFYLYYSVGNEAIMHIRVAVSERPDGGFVDAGYEMTVEDFAIDAHVFIDDDGTRYLFYATDFLEHSHIGTGIVVDRMVDWHTLEGAPRPVTRAVYDWQVYDPNRKEKGGVRWHTVEGPTVLKRKGHYFEMFSGGNWQNTTYGVSFAVTDDIGTSSEWRQFSNGTDVLPILRTLPGIVTGPGHNSVIRGPNNRELYCVYHCWQGGERVLAIDRMDLVRDRIFVLGATTTPQPTPFEPTSTGFEQGWDRSGGWEIGGGTASASAAVPSQLVRQIPISFLTELAVRIDEPGYIRVGTRGTQLYLEVASDKELPSTTYLAESGLQAGIDRTVRLELDGKWLCVRLDGWHTVFRDFLDLQMDEFAILTESAAANFSGFSITEGLEDLFGRGGGPGTTGSWETTGEPLVTSSDGEMVISAVDNEASIFRSQIFHEIEVAANICLRSAEPGCTFGISLLDQNGEEVARLEICDEIRVQAGAQTKTFALPDGWGPDRFHQYRLLVKNGMLRVYLEAHDMGVVAIKGKGFRPSVFCRYGTIAVEMVRATAV